MKDLREAEAAIARLPSTLASKQDQGDNEGLARHGRLSSFTAGEGASRREIQRRSLSIFQTSSGDLTKEIQGAAARSGTDEAGKMTEQVEVGRRNFTAQMQNLTDTTRDQRL